MMAKFWLKIFNLNKKNCFLLSPCLVSIFALTIWGITSVAMGEPLNTESNNIKSSQVKEKKEEEIKLQGIPKLINEIATEITVRIETTKTNGSGVIFAQDDENYYVVTAKHVMEIEKEDTNPNQDLENEKKYHDKVTIVAPDGKTYDTEHIKLVASSDLAILSFKSKKKYQIAAFSDYQFGLNQSFWAFVYGWEKSGAAPKPQLTVGQVVGQETGMFIVNKNFDKKNGYELVYTNLSEGGMSGGPVMDTNGRVIGIHGRAEKNPIHVFNEKISPSIGFGLGIPIAVFLNSNELQNFIEPRFLEIQTIKERADVIPFSRPELSQEDLDSIPLDLSKLANSNGSASELVDYGNKLWRASRYSEAVSVFDKAIHKKTEFYQAYYGKGLALYDLGNYQEACQAFEEATNSNGRFYPAWYRQSLTLLILKKYSAALKTIDKAIYLKENGYSKDRNEDDNNKYAALYAFRGEALQNIAHYNDAINSYSKAIIIEDNPIIRVRRGSIYRISENYEKALTDLNEAIQSDPKYTASYINRGLVYYQKGDYRNALANFNHVISLDIQNFSAYLGRGFVNHKIGEKNQALVDFNKAFQLYSKQIENNKQNNYINLNPNQYQQIATNFHNIITLQNNEGNMYFAQSFIYFLLDNKKQMLNDLKTASRLFQDQKDDLGYRLTQKIIANMQQKATQANPQNQSSNRKTNSSASLCSH